MRKLSNALRGTPPKSHIKMSSARQRKNRGPHSEGDDRANEPTTLRDRSTPKSRQDSTVQSFSLTSFLFHFSMLIFYTFVHVWGFLALMKAGRDKKLDYKFSPLRMLMFATIQNLYVQTFYAALAVVCDVVPASNLRKNLENLRNFIFTTFAFPLAMIVTFGYWGILAMSTGYLYDKLGLAVMEYVSPLLNQCWHTVVGVAVVVEVMFIVHRHSSHRTVLLTTFLLNLSYAAEVFVVYYMVDMVPYPFMRKLGPVGLAVFLIGTLPVYLGFCYLGRALSYIRWGDKCIKTV